MHRTRKMRNHRSGRSKRGGGLCWNCSPEKKVFKQSKNDMNLLNVFLNSLDDKKIITLYFELNNNNKDKDKQILLNWLQQHKPDLVETLKTIVNSPHLQSAMHNIVMSTNPVYAAQIGVLGTVQALTGHNDSARFNPYVLDPLFIRPTADSQVAPHTHSETTSVAVGGKSRRRRRRRSNKKSRKGCKVRCSSRP